jgi:hypothetical protein
VAAVDVEVDTAVVAPVDRFLFLFGEDVEDGDDDFDNVILLLQYSLERIAFLHK